MSNLIPSFIKSGFVNLIGGGSSGNNGNDKSVSNSSEAPKDLNELVDRIMDNPNIDNRTKREILTIILNNLQNEPSTPMKITSGLNSHGVPNHGAPNLLVPNPGYNMQPQHMPMQMQIPLVYPMQQPIYPQYPQFPAPQIPGFQQFPAPYYTQPMVAPQPGSYQLDMLTSKVNDLSGELGELVKLVKGQLGNEGDNHGNNMERIRGLISRLSSANNNLGMTAMPSPDTGSVPSPDTGSVPSPDTGSVPSPEPEPEPETVADLPSKTSNVNNSIVDTVGSAINSIGSALNLNSSKSEEPKPESQPVQQPAPTGLSDADRKILSEEQAAKSANNKAKEEAGMGTGNNMFSLEDYAANNNVAMPALAPAQQALNESIAPESIDEGLAAAAPSANKQPGANKQPSANKQPTSVLKQESKGLEPLPARVEGNPSGMLIPKKAEESKSKSKSKNTPPAGNLPSAIANINKIQQQPPVQEADQAQTQQQQQQTGGARTLKKKSNRSVLTSVADVLGLTTTTQKNPASKRGRPRKTK